MQHQSERAERGFTLIEIIGVLAIMSILAATIAPSAIQMITSTKGTAEDTALTAISDALRLYVQANKKIPNQTTWATDIASLLNTSTVKVSTNDNNGARIYLYPDDFFATSTSLAYDQAVAVAAGSEPSTALTDPRIMVISNMNSATTLTQASAQLTASAFAAIWDQSGQSTELTEGSLLKIARINLTDLFNPITLQNYDTSTQASYKVDGVSLTLPLATVSSNIITPSVKNMYLINTTLLDLYANGSISNRYTVQNESTAPTHSFSANTWSTTAPASLSTSSLTLSNGQMKTNWPPSCTATASYTLSVDDSADNFDYYLYYGDSAGSIQTPKSLASSSNCNNANQDNRIEKQDNTCDFTIPECSFVIIAPKVGKNDPFPLVMFYMPSANITKTLQ